MNYGIIMMVAQVWRGEWPVFRVMIMMEDNWVYAYIPATNYKLRVNDIVSWNDTTFYWHAEARTVEFDLLREEVTI